MLHDVGLVHRGDLAAAVGDGVVEGGPHDALRAGDADGLERDGAVRADAAQAPVLSPGDQLGGLGAAKLGLDARVEVLGVLAEDHDVDIAVARSRALDRPGGAQVGEEVEVLAQGHVDAAEARAHGRGHRTLDGDAGLGDGVEHLLRQRGAVLLHDAGTRVHDLPVDVDAGGSDDALHAGGDFGADAVSGDEGDGVGAHGRSFRGPTLPLEGGRVAVTVPCRRRRSGGCACAGCRGRFRRRTPCGRRVLRRPRGRARTRQRPPGL